MCKKAKYQKDIHKHTYMLIFAVIAEPVPGIKRELYGNVLCLPYSRNIRECIEVNFSTD